VGRLVRDVRWGPLTLLLSFSLVAATVTAGCDIGEITPPHLPSPLVKVGMYVLRLSIFLYAHNGADRFDQFNNPRTFVQWFSDYLQVSTHPFTQPTRIVYTCAWQNTIEPAFWFFIVMAINAFVMPSEVGLIFRVTLSDDSNEDETYLAGGASGNRHCSNLRSSHPAHQSALCREVGVFPPSQWRSHLGSLQNPG
jgi:hypothetical protein